jgi:hypothetical protein
MKIDFENSIIKIILPGKLTCGCLAKGNRVQRFKPGLNEIAAKLSGRKTVDSIIKIAVALCWYCNQKEMQEN